MTVAGEFWSSERWADQHMGELQSKYTNKWVAIINEKVAAVADDARTAEDRAIEKTQFKGAFPVLFIESGQNIYRH